MSVAPMLTAGALCWALTDVGAVPSASARAIAAELKYNPRFVVMPVLHMLHFLGGNRPEPKPIDAKPGRLVPFLLGSIEAYFGAVAKISGATQCGSQHSTMWTISRRIAFPTDPNQFGRFS